MDRQWDLASLSLDKKVDRITYGGGIVQAIVKKWDFLGFTQRGFTQRGVWARGVRGARGSSRLTSREAARTFWALSLRRKGIMSSYRSTFTSMSCVPRAILPPSCRPWQGVAWRGKKGVEGGGEGGEGTVAAAGAGGAAHA